VKKAYFAAIEALVQGTVRVSEEIEREVMTDLLAFHYFLFNKDLEDPPRPKTIGFNVYRIGYLKDLFPLSYFLYFNGKTKGFPFTLSLCPSSIYNLLFLVICRENPQIVLFL
jgi:hypothetical protein